MDSTTGCASSFILAWWTWLLCRSMDSARRRRRPSASLALAASLPVQALLRCEKPFLNLSFSFVGLLPNRLSNSWAYYWCHSSLASWMHLAIKALNSSCLWGCCICWARASVSRYALSYKTLPRWWNRSSKIITWSRSYETSHHHIISLGNILVVTHLPTYHRIWCIKKPTRMYKWKRDLLAIFCTLI